MCVCVLAHVLAMLIVAMSYGLAMLDVVVALTCLFLHVVATLFPKPTRLGTHDLPDTRSRHVVRSLCYSATDTVRG